MSDIAEKAVAAYKQGDYGKASSLAKEALTADPQCGNALGVAGLVRAKSRSFKEAVQYLTQAIEAGGDVDEVPAALAFCYARLNGPEATMEHLRRLLVARPDYTELRFEIAHLYNGAEMFDEELALCMEGVAAGDDSPDLLLFYGRALLNAYQPEKAADVLRKVTERMPERADGHYFLGTALKSLGRIEEAKKVHLAAMNQEAFYPRSFYAYMRSGLIGENDPVVRRFDELKTLLRRTNDSDATLYHFGMGKAFEDMGQYDEAFEHYRRGGAITAKSHRYDRAEKEREFAAIKSFFTRDMFAKLRHLGNPTTRPVFVVGMPRSGSTLIEQILASHNEVEGLGELLDLDRLCRPLLPQLSSWEAGKIPWAQIAAAYLERTSRKASRPTARLVDKGLHNFIFIGFIHVLFPNSMIIHCERDAVDTCFSCFSIRFASGHDWSNRLGDAAHYYRCYRDLMEHWNKVLPGRVVTIGYEKLATDFEPQVRQLLEACNLPWDASCLTFYETGRAVRTASSAQVREPINTSSIGRWKKFEKHLGELVSELSGYF